jgi:uncharacterized membrane protein YccC
VSDEDKPRDVTAFLGAFYRRVFSEMRGEHGSPARTAVLRVVVLLVVLAGGSPMLWGALRSMPTPLVVLIAAFVVFRVVRWSWRRYR